MRKLLSRIDHQEYTSQLEKLLVESGVVNGEAGLQELRATWYIPMLPCDFSPLGEPVVTKSYGCAGG